MFSSYIDVRSANQGTNAACSLDIPQSRRDIQETYFENYYYYLQESVKLNSTCEQQCIRSTKTEQTHTTGEGKPPRKFDSRLQLGNQCLSVGKCNKGFRRFRSFLRFQSVKNLKTFFRPLGSSNRRTPKYESFRSPSNFLSIRL